MDWLHTHFRSKDALRKETTTCCTPRNCSLANGRLLGELLTNGRCIHYQKNTYASMSVYILPTHIYIHIYISLYDNPPGCQPNAF